MTIKSLRSVKTFQCAQRRRDEAARQRRSRPAPQVPVRPRPAGVWNWPGLSPLLLAEPHSLHTVGKHWAVGGSHFQGRTRPYQRREPTASNATSGCVRAALRLLHRVSPPPANNRFNHRAAQITAAASLRRLLQSPAGCQAAGSPTGFSKSQQKDDMSVCSLIFWGFDFKIQTQCISLKLVNQCGNITTWRYFTLHHRFPHVCLNATGFVAVFSCGFVINYCINKTGQMQINNFIIAREGRTSNGLEMNPRLWLYFH